jgi:hypothetical protein
MTKLNANVRKDPRLARMDCSVVPFACQRMADGGFEIFVETFAPRRQIELSVLGRDRSQRRDPLASAGVAAARAPVPRAIVDLAKASRPDPSQPAPVLGVTGGELGELEIGDECAFNIS